MNHKLTVNNLQHDCNAFITDIVKETTIEINDISLYLTIFQLFLVRLAKKSPETIDKTLKQAINIATAESIGLLIAFSLLIYPYLSQDLKTTLKDIIRKKLFVLINTPSDYAKLSPFWDLFDNSELKPLFRQIQTKLLSHCFTEIKPPITAQAGKICVVIREFDANMSYGAHFEVFKNISKALLLNRKDQVHYLFILPHPLNAHSRTDGLLKKSGILLNQRLFNPQLLQREEKPRYASDELIKLNLVNSTQIHYISGFSDQAIQAFISEQQFASSLFFGGFLDCKNERAMFKLLNVPIMMVIMNKNNKLDEFVDLLLTSCQHQTSVTVQRFFYPVASQLIEEWQFPQRDYQYCRRIVTVLAHGRLEKAFQLWNSEECQLFLDLIAQAQVEWYLIGIETPELIPECVRNHAAIKIVKRENNLYDFFQTCDLFLQVPHSDGGGTAALKAAIHGMPVLALANTDPSAYLPDNQVCHYIEQLYSELTQLLSQANYRQQFAINQLDYIKQQLTIEQAAQHFRQIETDLFHNHQTKFA